MGVGILALTLLATLLVTTLIRRRRRRLLLPLPVTPIMTPFSPGSPGGNGSLVTQAPATQMELASIQALRTPSWPLPTGGSPQGSQQTRSSAILAVQPQVSWVSPAQGIALGVPISRQYAALPVVPQQRQSSRSTTGTRRASGNRSTQPSGPHIVHQATVVVDTTMLNTQQQQQQRPDSAGSASGAPECEPRGEPDSV